MRLKAKKTNAEPDAEVIHLDESQAANSTSRMQVLPSPSEPMAVAREFVEGRCLSGSHLTLYYWRSGWWGWHTAHWAEVDERTVKSALYQYTEHAVYVTKDGNPQPWSPNRRKITDLMDALAAVCLLPADIDQPSWLDGGATDGVIVAMANGLLDVARQRLLPHTPVFFNQTSVPFNYDPKASRPERWLKFVNELWPNEPEPINALGEWFGYVISGRTDLHKILLMVGPTRGGKGVISRVLSALIGNRNVAGPTLNSLGNEFGLAPLIGKPLAVISDARFAGRDASVVVERLLSISGEDSLTVNRKYRDQWTGKLPSRLHVLSNELPKLGDASTAIVGRMVLLLLSKTWLGHEDYDLEPTLHAELSGILNWSLAGLHRLTVINKNRFTRLPSADEAITTMRDLASPVAAFVREQCTLAADIEIRTDDLYAAFKQWTEDNGHAKKSKQMFGRDLRAAVPSVSIKRPRNPTLRELQQPDDRHRVYVGIDIRQG
jgi:putative DNA primase/helicase